MHIEKKKRFGDNWHPRWNNISRMTINIFLYYIIYDFIQGTFFLTSDNRFKSQFLYFPYMRVIISQYKGSYFKTVLKKINFILLPK